MYNIASFVCFLHNKRQMQSANIVIIIYVANYFGKISLIIARHSILFYVNMFYNTSPIDTFCTPLLDIYQKTLNIYKKETAPVFFHIGHNIAIIDPQCRYKSYTPLTPLHHITA